ncbi:MAG: OmpA family protein [Hydrocarboniphaga sp.]|uniref:OmpA family protein n=1 Tax=Hydrocarboniphaga sp. TaxID=2033016 RepID=UPI002627A1C3|nr:OmpA family protein [Hydrocarboniphaga sp.]MDB5967973.1 OmpA family protein [Hydrocarboniphaga sp.]
MNQLISRRSLAGLGVVLSLMVTPATAQESSSSRLQEGSYVAPMASYVWTDDRHLDQGFGGSFAAGYRFGWYSIELSGLYERVESDEQTAQLAGASVNTQLFPFKTLPNLYFLVGAGGLEVRHYPSTGDSHQFSNTFLNAGPGYLFPLRFGRYDLAVRAEALYRYGHRDSSPEGTTIAPDNFNYVLINLGLQLPLGRSAELTPPTAEPAAVVPVAPPPDSDGDGVPDERDRCPGTPAGTTVDDAGCPLAPPPPPCQTPEAGQKVDLSGCATGDTLVLHGVNFEFDKATLTPDAKAILDPVADALVAAPDIHVEIGGHTDAKGSDEYNRRLSQQRAQSVAQYLASRGVAASRMTAQGHGETQPVADNATEDGRELNRRVELKITESKAL